MRTHALKSTMTVLLGLLVSLYLTLPMQAGAPANDSKRMKDAIDQSEKAAKVFNDVMSDTEKGIPPELLATAKCVAVFPGVVKAGLGIGGRGGRGVASCWNNVGWSAPVYYNLGGSLGLQIGAESTDIVLLFMSEKAMSNLLSEKFTLGKDASASAGPVGQRPNPSAESNSDVLTYSKNKGLFAGVEMTGASITPDQDNNRAVYGEKTPITTILSSATSVPTSVKAFPEMLTRYCPSRS